MKTEVSAALLLSIAVGFLTMATNAFSAGDTTIGIACAVIGVAMMFATIMLVQGGIVQKLKRGGA
jgi:hypothetical protein